MVVENGVILLQAGAGSHRKVAGRQIERLLPGYRAARLLIRQEAQRDSDLHRRNRVICRGGETGQALARSMKRGSQFKQREDHP
ncbi:hypothetical protein GMST_38600 [Geomonas silvestris]|uniref:Uncharacterized protein n=1 Tax=Geomonas silvestris TaxID=2740184 RepID=A0A6V8MNA9_9BACT|nr:hypothetical protein GMST_38600 [Geomonas silvestris]